MFEDQYACTGGQLYGLLMGQDRFVADLRPLVQPIVAERGQALGHCCHPYDLCTKLIAEEAGVVVTDPIGEPRDRAARHRIERRLDRLRQSRSCSSSIEPVLGELLREHRLIAR